MKGKWSNWLPLTTHTHAHTHTHTHTHAEKTIFKKPSPITVKVNSACCWTLLFCLLKCLYAKIEAGDLASFLWLLRWMLKEVPFFPTYWSCYVRHWSKQITFACKVVKYLKCFFCSVTLECFCLLHLLTKKIV